MSTAVVRILVDPEGTLSADRYRLGVERLRADDHVVIAAAPERPIADRREIEVVITDYVPDRADALIAVCDIAFGVRAHPGVVTFVSRGSDEDAVGVLARFGVSGRVVRTSSGGEDIVTVHLAAADAARVPEGRLHTALEAALNAEVRIRFH